MLKKKKRGQVVVEYVLLLVIAVSMAMALMEIVSMEDGKLIEVWRGLTTKIIEDKCLYEKCS